LNEAKQGAEERGSGEEDTTGKSASPENAFPEKSHAAPERWQPKREFRTCVATLRDVYGFGPLVAAEAQRRGFYQAKRKAFVADGQEANWTIQRLHFPDFTGVTDFMHAVAYAYAAAEVTAGPDELWSRYLKYASACWQGRTGEVIAELGAWLEEHPLPENVRLKDLSSTDPRKIVHESFTYLTNNLQRMRYPEYRRAGIPITSSLIESLIKEFNWRVKGTEKFWNRPEEPRTSRRTGLPVRGSESGRSDQSAESILQVRAALLCDDNRLTHHLDSRPGSPFVRRRHPVCAGPAV
jgi:hypothetical protein